MVVSLRSNLVKRWKIFVFADKNRNRTKFRTLGHDHLKQNLWSHRTTISSGDVQFNKFVVVDNKLSKPHPTFPQLFCCQVNCTNSAMSEAESQVNGTYNGQNLFEIFLLVGANCFELVRDLFYHKRFSLFSSFSFGTKWCQEGYERQNNENASEFHVTLIWGKGFVSSINLDRNCNGFSSKRKTM